MMLVVKLTCADNDNAKEVTNCLKKVMKNTPYKNYLRFGTWNEVSQIRLIVPFTDNDKLDELENFNLDSIKAEATKIISKEVEKFEQIKHVNIFGALDVDMD